MAVSVDVNNLKEEKESNPETKYIPAGPRLARLVSCVELGIHTQMFKGQPAKYETGKNAGRLKPPCLHIGLTFEFPTCDFTGDYPLTLTTSRRMPNGDFFDALTVPPSLVDNTISKSAALRTKFVKYLSALQVATGKNFISLAAFAEAQVPLIINVTNKKVVKDGKEIIYANMKAESITECAVVDPVTGYKTDYSQKVPAPLGEYCKSFEWDAPTVEAWKALKPWDQKIIKDALNFEDSPICTLLNAHPELAAIDAGAADGSPVVDNGAPQEPTEPVFQPDVPVSDYEDLPV